MDLPPPNPTTTRLAAALLGVLIALELPAAVATAARVAALSVLDPLATFPLAGGGALGLAVLLVGLLIAALSAIAAVTLVTHPEVGRWIGGVAALVWLPLGCGVPGLLLAFLVAYPGERPVAVASPAPEPEPDPYG